MTLKEKILKLDDLSIAKIEAAIVSEDIEVCWKPLWYCKEKNCFYGTVADYFVGCDKLKHKFTIKQLVANFKLRPHEDIEGFFEPEEIKEILEEE